MQAYIRADPRKSGIGSFFISGKNISQIIHKFVCAYATKPEDHRQKIVIDAERLMCNPHVAGVAHD